MNIDSRKIVWALFSEVDFEPKKLIDLFSSGKAVTEHLLTMEFDNDTDYSIEPREVK